MKYDLTGAIPVLRELARNDPAVHYVSTSTRPRDSRKVYFVREAAKEALAKLLHSESSKVDVE